MTVGELKELLDEFGDHMEVKVVVERDASESFHAIRSYDVDIRTDGDGESVLAITVEV